MDKLDKELTMLCVGSIVPGSKWNGLVEPVFQEKGMLSNSTLFYCQCNAENIITDFVEKKGPYHFFYPLGTQEIQEYCVGDFAPVAFLTISNIGEKKLIIGRENEIIDYLIQKVINNSHYSIESQYKALKYADELGIDQKIKDIVYSNYYDHLKEYSQEFADEWLEDNSFNYIYHTNLIQQKSEYAYVQTVRERLALRRHRHSPLSPVRFSPVMIKTINVLGLQSPSKFKLEDKNVMYRLRIVRAKHLLTKRLHKRTNRSNNNMRFRFTGRNSSNKSANDFSDGKIDIPQ